MWCLALFSVTLPAGVTLEVYVAFKLATFALRREGSTFNKVWYVHVCRTAHFLLCRVQQLMAMEAASRQPMNFYMWLHEKAAEIER